MARCALPKLKKYKFEKPKIHFRKYMFGNTQCTVQVCLTQIEKTGQLVFLSRFHCTLTMEMFLRSPPSEGGFIRLVQNESYHSSAILHRWTFATFVLKNLPPCPHFPQIKVTPLLVTLIFTKQGKTTAIVLFSF